jgi:hypothetical protein
VEAGAGGSGCVCAMRVWRSGKQGGSVSSSVGVGGAVGGAFGEVKVLGGSVILVGSLGAVWFVSMAGAAVVAFASVEGGCCCSVSYEKGLVL